MFTYFTIAPTVSFEKADYSITEMDGLVEPVLILSNPSATDINVKVLTSDGSATGE